MSISKRYLSILAFAMVLPPNSGVAGTPSFNCEKAESSADRIICDSDALSDQDQLISKLYKQALETPNRPIAKRIARKSYIERQECEDAPCVGNAQRQEISDLYNLLRSPNGYEQNSRPNTKTISETQISNKPLSAFEHESVTFKCFATKLCTTTHQVNSDWTEKVSCPADGGGVGGYTMNFTYNRVNNNLLSFGSIWSLSQYRHVDKTDDELSAQGLVVTGKAGTVGETKWEGTLILKLKTNDGNREASADFYGVTEQNSVFNLPNNGLSMTHEFSGSCKISF